MVYCVHLDSRLGGNAVTAAPVAVVPARVGKTQAMPASNYRSLRDSDNIYLVGGLYINWAPMRGRSWPRTRRGAVRSRGRVDGSG